MTTVDLSWKLRAQKAEHAAESSAALVRELATNFEVLYSEIETDWIKARFVGEQFDGIVRAHRKAEALLSRDDVKKALEEKC